jgi:hypothetical protein
VYLTVTQNGIENPLSENVSAARFISRGAPSSVAGTTSYTTAVGQGFKTFTAASTGATNDVVGAGLCHSLPFNTSGAYFTGLNENASLNMVVKMIVEFSPGSGQGDLSRLATPSAPLDSRALELYAEAISFLPVGVPVGENEHGDWYRKVLRAIEQAAPVIGMGFAEIPGASAAGTAIGAGAGALERYLQKRDDAKAKQKELKKATPNSQPGMKTGKSK